MGKIRISEVLTYLNSEKQKYKFIGDENTEIESFSSLLNYKPQSLTWIKSKKNIPANMNTHDISFAIIQKGENILAKNSIVTPNSKEIFFSVIDYFWGGSKIPLKVIGAGTYISPQAVIGKDVFIGHNSTIDGEIVIEDGTRIGDNVVIKNKVHIGKYCDIQSLTVIGEDGFGYYDDGEKKNMIKHYGGVTIGEGVFIGSHVNIARGTIDNTVIGDGVRIAPSTHIGHNNVIKERAVVICSNLFGSVEVGNDSYITASTIRNQCKVGDNTIIGMGSIVTRNIDKNKVAFGIPAKVVKENNEE